MKPGTVAIVGAGPGDPELLTVRARSRLDAADLVLHDSLVGPGVVESVPEMATVEDVGKRPGGERTTQADINRQMVAAARSGERVVRLKGGDPTIFGRGGEEAEHLAANDVPFEIVPGISSMTAGPQVAGVPLTHREHASSLTVVTGHEDPEKPDSALDWEALARTVSAGGTLVVLMGVGRLPDYTGALLEHGVVPVTPVAVVERATLPNEFAVTDTLASIATTTREAGIEPPAVTIVGDVVAVGKRVAEVSEAVPAPPPSVSSVAFEPHGSVESARSARR